MIQRIKQPIFLIVLDCYQNFSGTLCFLIFYTSNTSFLRATGALAPVASLTFLSTFPY